MLTAEEENQRRMFAAGAASSASSTSTLERQVETWSPKDSTMLTPEEAKQRDIVTTFRSSDVAPGSEERAVETWSGKEPTMEGDDRYIQKVEQWKDPREAETHTEKHAGDWKPHDEGHTEESERLKRSATEWRDPRTGEAMGGKSMTEASHGGGTWHRMVSRGEMTMFLACPICGNAVYGSDDDDLSDELRFHFRDEHNIRRR
ncbi:MAG: hypothetical protein ISF22_07140 [Methanomassiliicoccus sp.]|nr:hypothetical protein [Methanomassiliicoccus sp.]